jgi:hypothetical protein
MNIRTELLETLIRQCVNEVLDQVDERVDTDGKPIDKSSGIGKGGKPTKVKPKWMKPTKFTVDVKKTAKINEEEEGQEKKPDENPMDKPAEPSSEPSSNPDPESPEPKPEGPGEPSGEPSSPEGGSPMGGPDEPEKTELPPKAIKGAVFVNPKDKSKLDPKPLAILRGQTDVNIERILHRIATGIAGARAKVSIGAKRMAREVAKNPNASVFFYLGKMDPESDEIFLMADKSLNVAKDESIQPGELTGAPVSTLPAFYKSFGSMTDDEYETHRQNRNQATPRYGIDESAKSMIKKVVNKILDGKR